MDNAPNDRSNRLNVTVESECAEIDKSAAIEKKICFLRLNAYALFDESSPRHFGGAEVRATTFAKGLAEDENCKVSFVTYNYGQSESVIDGVRVIPGPAVPQANVEGSFPEQANKAVHRELERIVRETHHDVYCCFGVNEDSGAMISACRRYGRKSILFAASDTDLSENFYHGSREKGPYGEDGHACFLALRDADEVVVQTEMQQELLKRRFFRNGNIIRNPIDLHVPDKGDSPVDAERFALWVGRADTIQKRPELCVDIAQRMQDVPFVMIMNRSVPEIYNDIVAKAPHNIHVVERTPFSEVWRYYAHAYALLNTSAFEGFPNSFLHAGKHSIPVASLVVDPDDCLQRSHGGHCAHGNLQSMSDVLTLWHRSPETAEKTGGALRNYIETCHNTKKVVAQLRELIMQL